MAAKARKRPFLTTFAADATMAPYHSTSMMETRSAGPDHSEPVTV